MEDETLIIIIVLLVVIIAAGMLTIGVTLFTRRQNRPLLHRQRASVDRYSIGSLGNRVVRGTAGLLHRQRASVDRSSIGSLGNRGVRGTAGLVLGRSNSMPDVIFQNPSGRDSLYD